MSKRPCTDLPVCERERRGRYSLRKLTAGRLHDLRLHPVDPFFASLNSSLAFIVPAAEFAWWVSDRGGTIVSD